jgi:hypothetical protein
LTKSDQLEVPIYQRTYSRTRPECLQLWSDIVCAAHDDVSGHFIGSIVYIDTGIHPAPARPSASCSADTARARSRDASHRSLERAPHDRHAGPAAMPPRSPRSVRLWPRTERCEHLRKTAGPWPRSLANGSAVCSTARECLNVLEELRLWRCWPWGQRQGYTRLPRGCSSVG